MKNRFDKLIALALAFLILVLPGVLSARERRGANLVITLKDGHHVAGELIAVKPDSLLLLNLAGKDESVDIAGIREINVAKKSRAMKGALYGFLAGAIGGIGYSFSREEGHVMGPSLLLFGGLFGVVGGLIGAGVAASVGKDKTIQLEGKSESAIKSALADLGRSARIRDHK